MEGGKQDAFTHIRDYHIKEGQSGGDILAECGKDVYELLRAVIKTYLDIDEDDETILAAWMMAAAFKEGFQTMPILFVNASKGSGKTRLLKLVEAILPEFLMTVNLTESALFRLSSMKRGLCLDEAERGAISNKERVNLTELLNVCYKRGGKVVRIEKRGRRAALEPHEYEVFNPVVLANIYGLSAVVEDRSINIVMKKTNNMDIIRMPELFNSDPIIHVLRDWFGKVSGSVGDFLDIVYSRGISSYYLYNIYNNIYTIPTQTTTFVDVKDFIEKSASLQVGGRDYELWLPLLVISFTFDRRLCDHLITIARQRTKEKNEDDIEFDRDTSVAIRLYAYLATLPNPEIYPKEFRDWFMNLEGVSPSEQKKHWMSAEWVGHFLKRTKARNSRTKTNRGYRYTISKAKLKSYLEARKALDKLEVGDARHPRLGQQAPHAPQRKIGEAPKQIDTGGSEVICGTCGKNTTKLYEYNNKYMCIDCMNAEQRKNEEI